MDGKYILIAAAPQWLVEVEHWWKPIGALLAAVYTTWKIVIPVGKHLTRTFTLIEEIEKLCRELEPNHGSSIKDAIHRIEARLMLIEARNDALLSDHSFGIFHCDKSGSNLYVNRTYSRMLAASSEDLLGFGWKNFIEDAELERYDKEWKEAFEDGREFKGKLVFTTSDGRHVRTSIKTYVLHDLSNSVIGYLGLVSNLDED